MEISNISAIVRLNCNFRKYGNWIRTRQIIRYGYIGCQIDQGGHKGMSFKVDQYIPFLKKKLN